MDGTSSSAAAGGAPPDNGANAPGDGGLLPSQRLIVTGVATVAVLAGIGIAAAIDYPWHYGSAAPAPAARDRMPGALALAAASHAPAGAQVARAVPAAPAAAGKPRRPAPAKPHGLRRHANRRPAAPVVPAAPAALAAAPRPAERPPPTIDSRYERTAKAQCAAGFEGLLCRETLRWQLCGGRWNRRTPGAAVCNVGKPAAVFPPLG